VKTGAIGYSKGIQDESFPLPRVQVLLKCMIGWLHQVQLSKLNLHAITNMIKYQIECTYFMGVHGALYSHALSGSFSAKTQGKVIYRSRSSCLLTKLLHFSPLVIITAQRKCKYASVRSADGRTNTRRFRPI
jgi:hypothetical protein